MHTLPRPGRIADIVYFSAIAAHLERSQSGSIARHRTYIDALRATGVVVRLGHFKRRTSACPGCGRRIVRHEEKETDVAIASRLLAPSTFRDYRAVLIVTGDTDLVPAIITARDAPVPPHITVAFPFRRVNRQLRQSAHASVRLKRGHYARHQLPSRIVTADGREIRCPSRWA